MLLHSVLKRTVAFLLLAVVSLSVQATIVVKFETVLGNVYLWLREDVAPFTVKNFLGYVESGAYDNTFVSRSSPNFVIQGGGFTWSDTTSTFSAVTSLGPIQNEYYYSNGGAAVLLNRRGTIAMAQDSHNVDSASNEWFINLADNAQLDTFSLSTFNGPYVVFGKVLGSGMDVVDAISVLPTEDQGALVPASSDPLAFAALPLIGHQSGTPVTKQNLALISNVSVVFAGPNYFSPAVGASGQLSVTESHSCVVVSGLDTPGNPSPGDAPANINFFEGFFSFQLVPIDDPAHGCTLPAQSDLDVANGLPVFATDVVLHLPAGSGPNAYYRYGPTPDDHTPHWYDFVYDGVTGARFDGDKVLLSFIDGERGDDDLSIDGRITDAGAPAIDPAIPSSTGSSGGGGAVDLGFLGLVALCVRLRRGNRRSSFPGSH